MARCIGSALMAMTLVTLVGCSTLQNDTAVGPEPTTVVLKAVDAKAHGGDIRYEVGDGKDNIGFWTDVADYVTWDLDLPAPGVYEVEVEFACDAGQGGSTYAIKVGQSQIPGTVPATGDWTAFEKAFLGTMTLTKAGAQKLTVVSLTKAKQAVMNLKAVTLRPR